MFERFTDRARRVVVLAQEQARMLNHDRVGSEHLLLGLVHEHDGVAARALTSLGITEAAVRQRVEEIVGRGKRAPQAAAIPFAPEAKKAMELSMREAMQLGHNYIGTEHLLLGLLRQGEGAATEALARLGAEPAGVRRQVIRLLHGEEERLGADRPAPGPGELEAGGGTRGPLAEVLGRLDALESRLAALELRIGTGPDVRALDAEIARARGGKESAIEAQDFETAAALRDTERQLLDDKAAREAEWAAAHRDLPSLSDEVERLRGLLGQHGVDPPGGAA
jgi:ATP-dependent Clp protease ATP-binding subunit ClpC